MSDKFFKVKKGMNLQPIDPSTITDAEAGDLILDSTSGNVLKSYNPISATFEEVKGQGGGFNYFENDGAEVDLSGFTVYANTTAGTKPDDFGGTPDAGFTLTRNTTDPLLGEADFLITKPAANVQGHGVYYQFTAENGHLASKLLFQTLAETSNLNDADISIWLVSSSDSFVADFNIISANNPDVSAGLPQIMKQFQLDSSDTEYRLCIHYNSTDTDAKTFRLDELKFAPSSVATSPVVTDWQEFTPTGTWTTNTTYRGFYRRVGDSAEIHVQIELSGAPNSGTLKVNSPNDLVIDTSKIPDDQEIGTAWISDSSDASNRTKGSVSHVATNQVQIFRIGGSVVQHTDPFAFTNGDDININYTVPIQGWSANTISSEDLGGREIVVEGAGNSGQVLSTSSDIPFISTKDTTNSWNGSQFTAPEAGEYTLSGMIFFNATDNRGVELIRSIGTNLRIAQSTTNNVHTFNGDFYLEKGETFSIRTTTGSGTLSNSETLHHIHIQKLASPQTILETETVAARYTSDSGQTVTSGGSVTIIYEDRVFDTHNAYNTSTGQYTVPVSGYYRTSASFAVDNSQDSQQTIIRIPGISNVAAGRHRDTRFGTIVHANGNYYLEKGTIIDVVAVLTTTANSVSGSQANNFSIERIK